MSKTRKITEGAMLAALVGVLLFINRETGSLFDFALYWFTPLPLAVYSAKYGFKDGLLPYVVIILLSFLTGIYTAVYYCIFGGIVGLIYGHLVSKKVDNHILLTITCSISVLSTFISIFVVSALFGYDLVEDMAALTTTLNEVVIYMQSISPNFSFDTKMIPMLFIIVTIGSALLEGLLIHLFAYLILLRFKIKVNRLKPINTIRINKMSGIIGGIIMLVSYLGMTFQIFPQYINICYFVYLICIIMFMVNGYLCALTILVFYKKRKFVYLLILGIIPPFNMILGLIGALDAVTNLRDELTILQNR